MYDMRRKDREISKQEAMAVLQKAQYGILSIASLDGVPYGIPLNYCVINDAIYFHTAIEGRKIDILAQNRSVSFCVIGVAEVLPDKFGMKYESAIVSGTAQEVTGREKQNALECMLKKYSQTYFNEGLEVIKANIDRARVYKIIIQTTTGKASR
jgi:nitroimidazol reductase NimA-like FMN-containing flavoprotein (pyridoxamine 5'-phosphate oxidase superfamily)